MSQATAGASQSQDITKYARYEAGGTAAYGIVDGDTVRELDGDLFSSPQPTGKTVSLSSVKLLAPCEPSKVIAVGRNYKSHIGNQERAPYPGLFAKYPTSIVATEESIIRPADAEDLHYEGEMVVVIGKTAKNVSVEDAPSHAFGVTCGNDVSERGWQSSDLQWFRAKASDTFGPMGPVLVTGLNYNDLSLETRVNGETRQSQRTSDLLFSVAECISYISQYVTLTPGDAIFSGTPGSTKGMVGGDVVEVEIEGIGVLWNMVTQAK
ncbi:MAG: fumarylacetoacetate hydrolase family protein [Candidatus Hydrogenedentes bacterium]|jgi:2-keto-4-pentenoate hydratase/2-oxohepta-3-ene-1,7-dioic acid hydratase in catechol pathway|nr:fumarylacetoacetate hydrolase family protein [Candidatus Hydrogenedentota bacterium]